MPAIREVVITGAGVVSPIGIGLTAFWDSLMAGRSGVKTVTSFPTSQLPVTFAGEITDFDGKQYITPRKSLKVMSREIQFAVAAAGMAVEQAGLGAGTIDPTRLGVVFGAELMHSPPDELLAAYRSGMTDGPLNLRRWGEAAMREIFPLWMLKYLPNMPACQIGIAHDARGPNNTITLGEVSSLVAIAEAARVIERGQADAMITGGVGSWLSPTSFVRCQVLGASRRNAAPGEACRPFDVDRDGRVFGEGAAAYVLESAASAAARKAPVLARLIASANCFQATRGKGEGIARALRTIREATGWSAPVIDHVNAHGASTPHDDPVEARSIHDVFPGVRVTAPSSYFGTTGAGGGAVEALATILSFTHQRVPATLNVRRIDPCCPIDVIHSRPACSTTGQAIKLSCSHNGQSVALAISTIRA